VTSDGATAMAWECGRSRARPARSHSPCLGLPSSAAPATRKNGRRASSRAISGECRRSMKR